LEYLVFNSEFLSLQFGYGIVIGEWAGDFLIDGFLQAAVTGPEGLNAILQRHVSSNPNRA
jgi:hypothetical protein